jgi:hypothetical protein
MIVKVVPNGNQTPSGKLADAELHFTEGALEGLKLIGFGIWERRGGGGRNVTFPARTYSVNGERRSFSLLRPIGDATSQNSNDRGERSRLTRFACFRTPPRAASGGVNSQDYGTASWE